jgi:hypothetical protein
MNACCAVATRRRVIVQDAYALVAYLAGDGWYLMARCVYYFRVRCSVDS